MNDTHLSTQQRQQRRREFQRYAGGAIGAFVITLLAFAVPVLGASGSTLGSTIVLALLAIIQIAVHFKAFLHVDFKRSHRHDLALVFFTTLIIVLMVSGSLWILYDQHSRM